MMADARRGGRRASDVAWYWQLIHFTFAFLVDHWIGISLTRVFAIVLVRIVWIQVVIDKAPLSWVHFWTLLAAISAAFGKTVWEKFLKRNRNQTEGQQTFIDATVRTIQERRVERDDGAAFEPA